MPRPLPLGLASLRHNFISMYTFCLAAAPGRVTGEIGFPPPAQVWAAPPRVVHTARAVHPLPTSRFCRASPPVVPRTSSLGCGFTGKMVVRSLVSEGPLITSQDTICKLYESR
eukprot:scaffold63438_cov57-Phaeocystis_antarctica.AAC.2